MKLVNLLPINILNESQKKWNSLDVSRKAEKELSNSEWNKRVGEKLSILKKLNSDGKFKKDWDEETLQGWVDKNYSWEKVESKFKPLKEDFRNEGNAPKYINGDLNNATIEYGGKTYSNIKFDVQGDPIQQSGGGATLLLVAKGDGAEFAVEAYVDTYDYADVGSSPEDSFYASGEYELENAQVDWETLTLAKNHPDYIPDFQEGSCGYSQEAPGGSDLKTPGNTQGMDGDDRTRAILRKLIKKEIANLQKEEPNEGNAFGAALQKAKEAGEKEFKFQGKKYTV